MAKQSVGGRVVDVPDAGDEAVSYTRRQLRRGESLHVEPTGQGNGIKLEVTRSGLGGKKIAIGNVRVQGGRAGLGTLNAIDRMLESLRR